MLTLKERPHGSLREEGYMGAFWLRQRSAMLSPTGDSGSAVGTHQDPCGQPPV